MMPAGNLPDGERRLRQAARFARILRVLELIQSRGRYGVKEIAGELECSERTVFRDLAVLALAGVPYEHDRESRSLRVRPGYRFTPLTLSDDELFGQATATVAMSAPGLNVTSGAEPTTRKLQASSKEDAARILVDVERVTSVLDLKLADHQKHHDLIRTIQWALIRGNQLGGIYTSPYDPKSKRLTLDPYRICLVGQAWYLIARPGHVGEPRTYRVARFTSLRMLDGPAVVPARFDLKAYFGNAWKVYRGGESYEITVRFSGVSASVVTETVWHSSQTVQRHRDGSVTLKFLVDGLNEIVHWVLGWSGRVAVLRPDTLRLAVLDHLKRAAELNQGG